MNKNYVIQWKSIVNGRAGRGTKTFAKAEAEQLVEELNREYPQILHEPVEADVPVPEGESESSHVNLSTPVLSIA
ncbi:MAG TPA: hypothetical protein VIV82_08535 [Verrucomicrobiae bacterium]